MAGVTLGFLKYVLGFDSIAFRKGMTDAERDLVKLQKSFEQKGQQLQNLGKGLTAFVTLPIAGIAAAGIREAQETQQAMAQVNAALVSTGNAAGVTAGQLKTASDALELKSLFEGDQILKDVSARLLAFGNITGATFGRAQQAIVDFATRTGRDLGSATTLIGKALNDPAKAMGVLSKAGVQLSADQQTLIKSLVATGNTAGAQAVLLGALETKFRGAAEAAQNADPINKFTDAWKQMAETIGTALLPILPVIADAVAAVANAFNSLSPGVQRTIIITAGLAAAFGPVLIGFGGLLKVIALSGPAVTALATAWNLLQAGFLAARVAALATLPALTPFLIPLAAIAAAVGVAYVAWKNWDNIKTIVAGVAAWVGKNISSLLAALGPVGAAVGLVVSAFKNWDQITATVQRMAAGVAAALQRLAAPFDWVRAKAKAVGDAFLNLYDRVVGHSYIPDMVDEIGQHLDRLDGVMVQPAAKAAKATAASFAKLKSDVSGVLDGLFPEEGEIRSFLDKLKTIDDALKNNIITSERASAARERLFTGGPPQDVPVSVTQDPPLIDPNNVPNLSKVAEQLPQVQQATSAWGETLREVGEIGRHALDNFNDGFANIITHSKSLKEAWHSLGSLVHGLAEDMLQDLVKLALKKAEMAIFGSLFGMKGGGLVGGFSSGGLASFATGGFVSGKGSATSDSIPALLSNGEFVINAAATKRFLPLLKQMNSGAMKFASGGLAMPRNSFRNDNFGRISGNRAPSVSLTNYNDFRGADPAAVGAIQARLNRMEAELPGRVVNVVQDARTRHALRF
jgi:hypothetical protein